MIYQLTYVLVFALDTNDFQFTSNNSKYFILGLQILQVFLTLIYLYKDRKNAGLEKLFYFNLHLDNFDLSKDCSLLKVPKSKCTTDDL
jgi:hypothetical protein